MASSIASNWSCSICLKCSDNSGQILTRPWRPVGPLCDNRPGDVGPWTWISIASVLVFTVWDTPEMSLIVKLEHWSSLMLRLNWLRLKFGSAGRMHRIRASNPAGTGFPTGLIPSLLLDCWTVEWKRTALICVSVSHHFQTEPQFMNWGCYLFPFLLNPGSDSHQILWHRRRARLCVSNFSSR